MKPELLIRIKCHHCKKNILASTEKYVLLGTYNRKAGDEELYFHFQCWADYYNQGINKQILKRSEMAMHQMGMSFGSLDNIMKKFEETMQSLEEEEDDGR